MRWFWIDRFEKFVEGTEAVAIKNVTLAEEPLDDYMPGFPHYAHTLIIEGMAQVGGILVGHLDEFLSKVVLAKISKADFNFLATPGDQLRLTATLVNLQSDGAIVSGKVEMNGKLQAEMELTFAILSNKFGEGPFFIPSDFSRLLRSFHLYDVGVTKDGQRLTVPQHMLDAEIEALTTPPT